MTNDMNALLTELASMPVQPGASLRLMRMLDDPRVSAENLGRVIETDPALSMQIIRLANTSYYGLQDPAASAWRAITVVGLSTVRSVVTTSAFDLFDGDQPMPDDYWTTSLAAAAGAAAVAKRIGIQPSDAFSAGLLQDLGRALIARRATASHQIIASRTEEKLRRVEIERDVLGFTHADITAHALAALRFPEETIEATRQHHGDPSHVELPLARVLLAADLIALRIAGDELAVEPLDEALDVLAIGAGAADEIVEEVGHELELLVSFLSVTA